MSTISSSLLSLTLSEKWCDCRCEESAKVCEKAVDVLTALSVREESGQVLVQRLLDS